MVNKDFQKCTNVDFWISCRQNVLAMPLECVEPNVLSTYNRLGHFGDETSWWRPTRLSLWRLLDLIVTVCLQSYGLTCYSPSEHSASPRRRITSQRRKKPNNGPFNSPVMSPIRCRTRRRDDSAGWRMNSGTYIYIYIYILFVNIWSVMVLLRPFVQELSSSWDWRPWPQ